MRVSDTTLRRVAWVPTLLFSSMLLISVPLLYSTPSEGAGGWGIGGIAGVLLFELSVMAFPFVGLLIVRKQPRNTIGWLLQGIGLVWGLTIMADSYARYGLVVNPGGVPGPDVVAALNEGSWAPGVGLMGTFLVLLFPDGRLPSPRWRPVAWLSGISIIGLTVAITLQAGRLEESPVPDLGNPIAWEAGQPAVELALLVFFPLLPLCIVACAVALVLRFRRSSGVERLQLKWLATAGAGVAFIVLLTIGAVIVHDAGAFKGGHPGWLRAMETLLLVSFVLPAAAIGVAVLRHRLYELDLVINRALVYATLTAVLAGVYLGSVLLLQLLLSPLTSQSDLAVAGSTLAVSALFGPLRRRIQRVVDRRFYRSRYDAAQTINAFADRLRQELVVDAIGAELRATVRETMQPERVSLWLRP
jgi:hypothetical protein